MVDENADAEEDDEDKLERDASVRAADDVDDADDLEANAAAADGDADEVESLGILVWITKTCRGRSANECERLHWVSKALWQNINADQHDDEIAAEDDGDEDIWEEDDEEKRVDKERSDITADGDDVKVAPIRSISSNDNRQ